MKGEWKDINGFVGRYQISTDGKVRSIIGGRLKLRQLHLSTSGYTQSVLLNSSTKKTETFLVHRLVAIAFIPNPDNKPFINHINGDKRDNRVANLEWCTPKENSIHAATMRLNKNFNEKAVVRIKDGEVCGEYYSIESTKLDGFSPSLVRHVLCGTRKKHKDFEWRYKTPVACAATNN